MKARIEKLIEQLESLKETRDINDFTVLDTVLKSDLFIREESNIKLMKEKISTLKEKIQYKDQLLSKLRYRYLDSNSSPIV